MKVTRAQAEENRERIVAESSRLFREKGFSGVGLNDLMQAAGLTRGGFYGHFASKQDLEVEACRQALQANAAYWRRRRERDPADALADYVGFYTSPRHRDHPGEGCALAALAVDVARTGGEARAVYAEGVEKLVGFLAELMEGDSTEVRRERALAVLPTLIGTLLLSRAVGEGELAEALASAGRAAAMRLAGRGDGEARPD
ncbi:TetR family transcriptional regulator [Verticiella sediminum]|uniref:TetR family transcriptional regulator n=1 Tax=Verticiella sediminum TaxID=1247510 RepID=A0A556B191_9BURK|nr:TetR family transcriptional regulator [Verticiella sediminum]TSH98939.1 TetR family transcriptional regulator [Verticiella sediminum]